MRTAGRTDRITLLLTGFLVLFIPLWFFNSLLKTAMERTRESASGLLREDIMQTAEHVRLIMQPAKYVKEVLREVHREVLPRITPDLIRMRPDEDFGKDIFDARLPEKLLQEMRKRGLDAILVHVNGSEFASSNTWFCDDLIKQCHELKQLALEQSFLNYHTANSLFQQYYQKVWPKHFHPSPYLTSVLQSSADRKYCFAWLSRFTEMIGSHDRVEESFTDYFGQQSIYYYSYSCMSAVNMHGAYTIIVPQKAIDPAAILKRAAGVSKAGLTVSIVETAGLKAGFVDTPEGLEFYAKPPSEFWSHYLFSRSSGQAIERRQKANLTIRFSGTFNPELKNQKLQFSRFRFLAAMALMTYVFWAFRCWLFGFELQLSTRRKLALILGIIVILPVLGVGVLTFLALQASSRVMENHLVHQTLNSVRELAILNDENSLRQVAAGLELKRRLEANGSNEKDLVKLLVQPGEARSWITTWTNSMTHGDENGLIEQYSGFLDKVVANRLVNSLIEKYMDSLGIENRNPGGKMQNFSRTMTLGIMENYITPELEEAWIVHENTAQRELSHTADTSKAILLLIKDIKNRYRLLYQRLSNYNEAIYRYLSHRATYDPFWFVKRGRYGDVSLGVRLRKILDLFMFGWPTETLLLPEMSANFDRALSTQEMGQSIIRKGNDFEVRAWRYKEGESAIISAIGKNRGANFEFAGLATGMLFPFLTGYALLLLYFITSIIVEFINGPVRIINHGIDALSREEYGVMIASFSEDEFDKVTRAFNEMSNALKQREMIKRYVSGVLVQQMQSSDMSSLAHEGKLIKVAILASDIRGFTSISEKYSPAEVVEMLNSYFTLMEQAISEFGGAIDKYIGDAVQAVFYEDPQAECPSLRACRAALRMRQKLRNLNLERTSQGLFAIDNGIGIDSGMVISGSIGSETGRKDFTVTGRIIEQAAQLESQTKNTESRILVSHEVFNEAATAIKTREFSRDAMELISA